MADEISFLGPQYYHRHDYGNGNVGIWNGKWNHVFKWYTYTNGDPPGYDHPKNIVLDHVDEEGNKYWRWEY